MRAKVFDLTTEEAAAQVFHTTTWQSFNRLLEGKVDMIFSCPMSDDQRSLAKQNHVELETVPLTKEGFVFVVNAKNPVNSLTQEQLRKIYSGEITNWKEVGGNDAEIIAYQRNNDSGSQNLMIDFMGDTPLMDAPSEMRPNSMGYLMDVIAINDNAENAIGYSVYAYAANMYGNGNEIKFIEVDGVAPTKNTMADGSYPLLGINYAVFNANQPQNSNVRMLAEWAASYDGQLALAEAGYVTVKNIGYDYEEMTLEKYEGVGTGGKAPQKYTVDLYYANLPLDQTTTENGDVTYKINCLKDKKLQAEVNAYIAQQVALLQPLAAECDRFLESGGNFFMPGEYGYQLKQSTPEVAVYVQNGYLQAEVVLWYYWDRQEGYRMPYHMENAIWDMFSGERLTTEDLFYDGVDIDEVLNTYLRTASMDMRDEFYGYYELKAEFASLTNSGWHVYLSNIGEYFSADSAEICFDKNNPYFAHGVEIALDELPNGVLRVYEARDFSDLLIAPTEGDAAIDVHHSLRCDDIYLNSAAAAEDSIDRVQCNAFEYAILNESRYPQAKKINAMIANEIETCYSTEYIWNWLQKNTKWTENQELTFEVQSWFNEVNGFSVGDRYLFYSFYHPHVAVMNGEKTIETFSVPLGMYLAEYLIFDMQTGEKVAWHTFIKGDWHTMLSKDSEHVDLSQVKAEELHIRNIRFVDDICIMSLMNKNNSMNFDLHIPFEQLNW